MTRAFTLALVASALAACHGGTTLVAQCTTDSDCSTNFHCGLSGPFQGYCLCSNDQACPQDAGPAFCNPAGQCQVKVGCQTDLDCQGGSFCDTALELCVSSPACGSNLDCQIGYICDGRSYTCEPGCHSNGDCAIDVPCVCGNGLECVCPPDDGGFIDPATYNRSLCEVGTCNASTCAGDTQLCPYNDTCTGSADSGLSTCEADPRMNVLCEPCTGGVASSSCGSINDFGANFCLIDLYNNDLYCGVDCSHGQLCPSGYSCQDIIILTQNPCTAQTGCAPTGAACTPGDAGNCPVDTQCAGSGTVGQCAGNCVINEGSTEGFCGCVTNADCPTDVCDSTSRTCSISGQPCDPSNANTCNAVVSCVDFGGARGCYVGRNCAPNQGLHCPITQTQ